MITSIDDRDIDYASRLLAFTFDEPARAFLRHTSSCHVHACPGSGKTTLLIAKLAVLANRWQWRDRGILVLSHTNVARQEVERRIAQDAGGARLLNYPHFIGTIQAFVDRFLALPYLRDIGLNGGPIREPRIDDELFEAQAWGRFNGPGWRNYPKARAYLNNRHDQGRSVVGALTYVGADRALALDGGGAVPRPATPTGQQLRALKDSLASDGLFRYSDMFAFAASAVKHRPYLRAALRARFPWVFVDEMQDTASTQDDLLNDLFGPDCIMQKLGDTNQGIFGGAGEGSNQFSWSASLDLPNSHRLAPKIAAFASRLTAVHPQTLVGNPRRRDRAHTIFLFRNESIAHVLPAFGDLILREWADGLPSDFSAKAVGFRRNPPSSPSIPGRISDYWKDFPAELHADRVPMLTLVAAIRFARRLVDVERQYASAYRAAMEALAHLLEQEEGVRVTRQALKERFRDGRLDSVAVRAVLATFLTAQALTAEQWGPLVERLLQCLLPQGSTPSERTRTFLAWDPSAPSPSSTGRKPTNVYRHEADARGVDILVSTIHGVKGETHDATLLLETIDHEHDVAHILPHLCGAPATGKVGSRLVSHLKRAFVAITRPTELVCIAVHCDHVSSAQRAMLRSEGWQFRDLDFPNAPPPEA